MKLMESLVESVLLYGAEVWGCGRQLEQVEQVQLRAARIFLGVGRLHPKVALLFEMKMLGELIVSKYVAESITMIAGRFGHEGLCQLRTELKKLQCEIGYIANTGQWCCVMLSGCINNQ